MVKIPLLRRQPKPDSSPAEDEGVKEAKGGTAPAAGKGTPFTIKPPERREERPASPAARQAWPAAPAPGTGVQPGQFVVGMDKKVPFPTRPPAHDAVAAWDAPRAPVVEPAAPMKAPPQAEEPRAEALAILRAIPDLMFLIGPNGVRPALGDGPRTGAAVLEELARRHEQHTKKAMETGQMQAFELRVGGGGEAHDLEARLVPLNQAEVLALVRDVTERMAGHKALIESRDELEGHLKDRNAELIRVNKMLKAEMGLRGEQEEVLKKNFRRLERLLEDTIGAITMIVQERDPHVADHQRRVSQLACAIGQDMNLRNDQMRAVRMAALLHDLGKIFIPAEILRKPGKLTPAEMSVVKTHPDTDYRILKRIDFPISIADVVRQHHERVDGSGYPQGLKGDSILLEARILAVADVIEGMVFERPYRAAPGIEAALKEIADNKGRLYDTVVAETCLKLFAEERFKFEAAPAVDSGAAGLDPGGQDL